MEIEIKGNLRIKIDQISNTASIIRSPKAVVHVFIPHFAKYKIISIDGFAFDSCNIESLTFAEDSEVITFKSNCLCDVHIKKLGIPASLKNLQNGWCASLYDLTQIEISPNNRHFIFYNNQFLLGKSLESIDKFDILHFALSHIEKAIIPPQISVIKTRSFFRHKNLKSVKFSPNTELKQIGHYAFYESSIESLSLPASVEQIDECCFSSTSNLREVEISPENKRFKLIEGKYVVKESQPGSGVFDVIIFARRDIESVSILPSIKVIDDYAFYSCKHLKNVTFELNSSLESIKKHAFDKILGSQRFILPPSLKEAECYSFTYIKNVKWIEFLGISVTIKRNCFDSSQNFEGITFPNAEEVIFDDNSCQARFKTFW